MQNPNPVFALLRDWANPKAWLMPISLWTAVALTLISGANYVWSSRKLLVSR
jgi:hypothetical protein